MKPNVQWWNHGASNLEAVGAFVDLVMGRPGGFAGEVVLAENVHRGPRPWEAPDCGWTRPFRWNGGGRGVATFNELCDGLKRRHGTRFSTVHWVDTAAGGRRVFSPADGPGYVICDGTGGVPMLACDNGLEGPGRRVAVMSYPVFRTDAGTTADFRKGIWERGGYTGRPLRYVSFSTLNHHSIAVGVTSALKNCLGVVDLSGGADPLSPDRPAGRYQNFHSFALERHRAPPVPGMLGRAAGTFAATVRGADLHVTTAEWVGLISRLHTPAARTRAVLAGRDPVALEHHAAKHALLPNSGIPLHDPDYHRGPLWANLRQFALAAGLAPPGGGTAVSVDLAAGGTTSDGGSDIRGEISRGRGDLQRMAAWAALRLLAERAQPLERAAGLLAGARRRMVRR